MSEKDVLDLQKALYRSSFLLHGDRPQGTLQNNVETVRLRFERLIRNLGLETASNFNRSVHDVGSGTCALHGYLDSRGIPHEYSGTEIVEEMVECSKKKYPEVKILNRDLVDAPSDEIYDFVVLSGTFNHQVGEAARWKAYCFQLIEAMYSHCRLGIAFNFLTTYNTFSAPELLYLDPTAVFDFCARKLSRHVILDQGYLLYEATVTVLRQQAYADLSSNPAFAKYFNPKLLSDG